MVQQLSYSIFSTSHKCKQNSYRLRSNPNPPSPSNSFPFLSNVLFNGSGAYIHHKYKQHSYTHIDTKIWSRCVNYGAMVRSLGKLDTYRPVDTSHYITIKIWSCGLNLQLISNPVNLTPHYSFKGYWRDNDKWKSLLDIFLMSTEMKNY